MKASFLALLLGFVGVCAFGMAYAQESEPFSHFDASFGGGFTEPTGRGGNNVNTGWNIDARGGYRATRNLALDLDFNYNRWNLNNAALARFGEPGGYTTIWSASFTPVIYGSPHWHIQPYALGGPGIVLPQSQPHATRPREFFLLRSFLGLLLPGYFRRGPSRRVSDNLQDGIQCWRWPPISLGAQSAESVWGGTLFPDVHNSRQ